VRGRDRIELRLQAPDTGSFETSAVAVLSAKTARKLSEARKNAARRRRSHMIAYGTASGPTRPMGTMTLVIAPHPSALSALRKFAKLRLLVTVTFTPRGGKPSSQSRVLNLRL
jgi:hypothetical protein